MEKQLEFSFDAIKRWQEEDKENRAVIVLAIEENSHPDGRLLLNFTHSGYRGCLISALAGLIYEEHEFKEMMLEAIRRVDACLLSENPLNLLN